MYHKMANTNGLTKSINSLANNLSLQIVFLQNSFDEPSDLSKVIKLIMNDILGSIHKPQSSTFKQKCELFASTVEYLPVIISLKQRKHLSIRSSNLKLKCINILGA